MPILLGLLASLLIGTSDFLGARSAGRTTALQTTTAAFLGGGVAAMCDRADGFIALPGGYGTLDEVLEILTWNQIGSIAKPVAFLDVSGYFELLFRFLDDGVEAGLVMPAHRAMAQRATAVADAILIACGPAPASPGKWTDPTVR